MKSAINKLKSKADYLSLVAFVACLFFPGFYVGETQRENPGYALLLTGWLGVFGGHFSWLANPLFLIAFFRRNTKPSQATLLAFFGFVIALEFLVHKRILTDEGGGTAQITGVGWGYVLWLTSFLVLFSSVIEKIEAKKTFVNLVYLTISVLLIGFAYIYFSSIGSHWALLKERERRFSELCKITGEQFFATRTSPILGIYFSESGGAGYRGVRDGKIFGSMEYGMFSSGGLDEIPLIERRNDGANPKQPYIRGRHAGTKDELVSELRSNYFVLITNLTQDIPNELALSGRELIVKEQGVDKPLAKMAYAVSREDNKFCGLLDKDNSFYEVRFVYKALGLTK
jgi:hypothetical protein